MSRNKDIQILHELSGLPYKECRQRMKECQWDLLKATGAPDLADVIISAVKDVLVPAIKDVLESAAKASKVFEEEVAKILNDCRQSWVCDRCRKVCTDEPLYSDGQKICWWCFKKEEIKNERDWPEDDE